MELYLPAAVASGENLISSPEHWHWQTSWQHFCS